MLEIDGSAGGQVLRTSVALSALLGKKVRITNIRVKRRNPGLRAQHIAGVEAVAQACSAEVSGCDIGSREIEFFPGEVKGKKVDVSIETAGSVGLVMQALLPLYLLSNRSAKIEVRGGGTAGKWSPPVHYMDKVFLGIMRRFGARAEVEIIKHGFYPKGGAEVAIEVGGMVGRIELLESGDLKGVLGISVATSDLRRADVARRQKRAAMKELEYAKVRADYVEAASTGTYVVLWADYANAVVGADVLGERGVPSEVVGQRCAEMLKSRMGQVVDQHAADSLVPYVAVAGGEVACAEKTQHIKTNIKTCSRFGLDVKLENGLIKGS